MPTSGPDAPDGDKSETSPEADPSPAVPGEPSPAVASETGPRDESGSAPVAASTTRSRSWRHYVSKFELPILVVVAVAIAIVLKTFVIQPFYIPSQSMEQTLHGCPGCKGDRILVFKPVYHVRDPHPGDIVVFKAPVDWDEGGGQVLSSNPVVHGIQWFGQLVGVVPPSERDLVKRVIATGGQTVKCCDANGNVQVSDAGPSGPYRSLNEPYIFENSPLESRTFGPVTVPKGRLWVLGDHRGDSQDSRYHCGKAGSGPNCDPVTSTVPESDVIGKAVVIAWPPSRWRTLGTPKTFAALGLPGGLPVEPGAVALAVPLAIGGVRRRFRRR